MAPTPLAYPSSVSLAERVPPQLFFVVSAVFHYLGPAFAVLLFAQVAPLGVAWLRIASAAVIFAVWRRRLARHRPSRRRHAHRDDSRPADRHRGCRSGFPRPAPPRRRDRRRHLVFGHPLCLRSARHGAAEARELRAPPRAPAGDRIR